jgi:hypothetical protein
LSVCDGPDQRVGVEVERGPDGGRKAASSCAAIVFMASKS